MKPRTISIILLILFTILSRFIPHPPNFTPVIGVGLFAGATINRRIFAFLIPFSIMFISDIFLGLHTTMVWVYGSLIFVVLVGILITGKVKISTVLGGSVIGSILFFLATNFGVWITGGGYGHPLTMNGLVLCYIDGIPFFMNTLGGTILYSGLLFGGYEVMRRKIPSIRFTPHTHEQN